MIWLKNFYNNLCFFLINSKIYNFELFKTILRELPQTLKDVAEGAKTFEKLDKDLISLYDDIKIDSHTKVTEEEVFGKKAE